MQGHMLTGVETRHAARLLGTRIYMYTILKNTKP
jgi:hypothetical protein